MRIILASALGMCFGVRQALETAQSLRHPDRVTIYGEIVHNRSVLDGLSKRGFRALSESDRERPVETAEVLITAHGVSDQDRERLASEGARLIDTTCPLVEKAHEAARRLESCGYHVIVIGKRDHVEVRGLIGDLRASTVVERPDDVETYPHPALGVICQTTATRSQVQAVVQAIRERNPGARVRWIDTVCQPTKDRQVALDALLPRVDLVIVVGGRQSNNTRRLAERARAGGLPAHHIESASELRAEWFADAETVGLTAGTSTEDEVLAEVHRRLLAMAAAGSSVDDAPTRTSPLFTPQGLKKLDPDPRRR